MIKIFIGVFIILCVLFILYCLGFLGGVPGIMRNIERYRPPSGGSKLIYINCTDINTLLSSLENPFYKFISDNIFSLTEIDYARNWNVERCKLLKELNIEDNEYQKIKTIYEKIKESDENLTCEEVIMASKSNKGVIRTIIEPTFGKNKEKLIEYYNKCEIPLD